MIDYIFDWLPFLQPNDGDAHGDKHAVDRDHLTDHDFRLEFEDIVVENGFKFENY